MAWKVLGQYASKETLKGAPSLGTFIERNTVAPGASLLAGGIYDLYR
jgi:hypothetical protein